MPLGVQLRQVMWDEPIWPIKHWHEEHSHVCLHINKGSKDPSNRSLVNMFPGVVHGDESTQLGMRAMKLSQADC